MIFHTVKTVKTTSTTRKTVKTTNTAKNTCSTTNIANHQYLILQCGEGGAKVLIIDE